MADHSDELLRSTKTRYSATLFFMNNNNNNNTERRIWLTEEQQLDAVRRYLKGEPPPKIAETLGVCANNIRNALRRHGVTMRTRSEAHTVYDHWKDAFSVDTPESKYWSGFLCADGSVLNYEVGAPTISVGLAARDRGHLEKLRLFLRTDQPIYDRQSTIRGKTHAGVRLDIRSTSLVGGLTARGLNALSLERVASPDLVDSRDFWRGVVDGDGYVGREDRGPRLGVCGGKELLEQFLTFMQAHGIGTESMVQQRPGGKLCVVAFTKRSALAAIDLLYRDACVVLDRKDVRAQWHLTHNTSKEKRMPGPARSLSSEQEADIVERYRSGASVAEISRALGVATTTLLRTLKRSGVEARPAPSQRRLTEDEQRRIVARYAVGATYDDLSSEFSLSKHGIGNVLRKHGVALARGRRTV